MLDNTRIEQAIAALRKARVILAMPEVLRQGIHRRQLYALRDSSLSPHGAISLPV